MNDDDPAKLVVTATVTVTYNRNDESPAFLRSVLRDRLRLATGGLALTEGGPAVVDSIKVEIE